MIVIRRASVALAAVAAGAFTASFYFPFLRSEFFVDFPFWVPTFLHDPLERWLIDLCDLPVGDQYLWGVIHGLFLSHDKLLGLAILLFSVILPALKIALVLAVGLPLPSLSSATRTRMVLFLHITSKWSMADVFIVGMILVFFKAEGLHFHFRAGPGLYLFATAALTSGAAVQVLDTKRSNRRRSA